MCEFVEWVRFPFSSKVMQALCKAAVIKHLQRLLGFGTSLAHRDPLCLVATHTLFHIGVTSLGYKGFVALMRVSLVALFSCICRCLNKYIYVP